MGRPRNRRGELRKLLSGSTGALLFEGDSAIDGAPVMVIATGIVRKGSLNVKLGDVVQLWIIRQDVEPLASLKDGRDVSVCGDCKFRPQEEQGGCRACYVNVGMAQKIWEAWTRGHYSDQTKPDLWREFFGNRVLRVGAYGDPVVVPHTLWEEILEPVRGWVGYTHGWLYAPARFKSIVMASVDSPEERERAKRGRWPWRTFRSRFETEPILSGEIECPAQPRIYKPKIKVRIRSGRPPIPSPDCENCRLCNGLRYFPDPRADLSVVVHGWSPNVAAYPVARQRGSLPLLVDHFH